MRVHRITLRSYRGVASCELTFADRGVTVVEGDNEVGKSSAAEALHLVLEYRDDSTARAVKAVRPLHLDAGAEVEVELSAGAHRFVYTKRWHKGRFTRLKVLSPAAQVLSGREAHDRVRALLAESVDLDLWRALSTPQAEGLRQRPLRDHPSLVAALDAAAGGDLGADDDGDLLARAEAEAARWWTPTGRPKSALADLRAAATEAEERVAACRQALEDVEADVAWCADLERSAADVDPKLAAATAAAEAAAAHLADLQQRAAAVEGLDVAARLATSEAALAAGAVAARRALADRATGSAAALAAASASEDAAAVELDAADDALDEALGVAAGAEAALAEAAGAAEAAGSTHTGLAGAAALAAAERRLAEAARHQAALDEALAAVAANPSSPAALAAVQAAHDEALRAEAALAAGQASVRLEALADVAVVVDGEAHRLPGGSVDERGVTGVRTVEVPGALRLTVTGGADARALDDRLRQAEATLAARCADLGVEDLAGAQALEQDHRAQTASAASARAALAAALEGTSPGRLAALVATAREAIGAGCHGAPTPTAGDVAAARARWDEANEHRRRAERSADRADAGVDAARRRADAAGRAVQLGSGATTAARADLLAATEALDEARAGDADRALADAEVTADERARAARAAWERAAAEVAALDLPGAAQAAQRCAVERDGLTGALRQIREDLAAIRSRLELRGESGLHDRLADAERAATATAEQRDSVEGRAAAARLLHATLTRHRDEAAQAYGAPLRARIESLGRPLFGDGFAVHLDDELRVAARVLDGVPVPWDDLSVGAREQLAVLTRLAAATLVSPDGGVPVVFDDVLGSTDPGRLALVSQAFEAAAEHCQIIVLTCDPARYRHLARGTTHSLTAPRGLDTRAAG